MRRHAPFEPIDPNICMWGGVHDVINPANFFENRPMGFGATRPRNLAFPIDFAGRPYNTLTLPCEVWYKQMLHFFKQTCKSVHICPFANSKIKNLDEIGDFRWTKNDILYNIPVMLVSLRVLHIMLVLLFRMKTILLYSMEAILSDALSNTSTQQRRT